MAHNIQVLVQDKETQNTSVITYKAFLDVKHRFNLIGQSDDDGNLIPGDPNLQPQHQRAPEEKSLVDVDAGGKTIAQKAFDDLKAAELFAKTQVTEKVESPSNVNHEIAEKLTESILPASYQSEITSQNLPKERKKPGPKPKIKDII